MRRRSRSKGLSTLLIVLLTALTLNGCAGGTAFTRELEITPEIAELVSALTLRQRIGQRFIGWLPSTGFSGETRDLTQSGEIGGFILYRWNFDTIDGLKTLTRDMQKEAANGEPGIALFLAADQEGGRVAAFRFDEFVQLPSPFYLADILPLDAVEAAAYINAVQMRSVGINMNLAPVLDLYPMPDNTIIGDRSFGYDETKTALAGGAFVRGTLRGGVLPVIKHFPGHGVSSIDSHGNLPVISSLDDREFERHLSPFRAAIDANVPAVMTAHLLYPGMDPVYPVTLSEFFIRTVLRQELGFTGLVVSDGLSMGALLKNYTIEDTLARCFHVGIDIILVHSRYSIRELIDIVVGLVEKGIVTEEQIDEGVFRVLAAKKRAGLLDG